MKMKKENSSIRVQPLCSHIPKATLSVVSFCKDCHSRKFSHNESNLDALNSETCS